MEDSRMFQPIKSTRVYKQVIDQIQQMIGNGQLNKGDKLPSERQLAEQLMVSRSSIREALRALEIIGLVEVRQGEGNFIKESFDDCLVQPLSMMFMLQESHPREIVDLRKAIEVEAAYRAAQRITDEEISELNLLIQEFRKYSLAGNEKMSVELDKELHYKICNIANNYLFTSILNMVSVLMDNLIEDARGIILMKEENKEELILQHENIVKGLSRKKPEEAAEAMGTHIEFIIDEYLAKLKT